MAEIILLNRNWRVADNAPQWALQYRDGNAREKASGWVGRKCIRDRDHLLRRIGELCGEVSPGSIETIRSWPKGYVTWKLQEMQARAGPDTGPHSAISGSNASVSPQDDDALHAAAEAA